MSGRNGDSGRHSCASPAVVSLPLVRSPCLSTLLAWGIVVAEVSFVGGHGAAGCGDRSASFRWGGCHAVESRHVCGSLCKRVSVAGRTDGRRWTVLRPATDRILVEPDEVGGGDLSCVWVDVVEALGGLSGCCHELFGVDVLGLG